MNPSPSPDTVTEPASLLDELGVGNGFAEPELVALARCAALVADCPAARVSFFDNHRHWLKGDVGFDTAGPETASFLCRQALRGKVPMLVADLARDLRFAKDVGGAGVSRVRFYAGFPIGLGGMNVGVLCVLDSQPRHLRSAQIEALGALASNAELWLASRRDRLLSAERESRLRDFLALSMVQMWECDVRLQLSWYSADGADGLARLGAVLCIDVNADVLDLDGRPSTDGETLRSLLIRREPFAQRVVQCWQDGPARYLELAATPQWSAAGCFLGYRGTVSDRTEWIRLWRTADRPPP